MGEASRTAANCQGPAVVLVNDEGKEIFVDHRLPQDYTRLGSSMVHAGLPDRYASVCRPYMILKQSITRYC